MMFSLKSIEKKQNIKFPAEYRQLYESGFQEMDNRMKIYAGNDVFCIRKFLTADEMNDVLDEFYDLLGYDIIPIAETTDDDYICLYYREDRDKPSVIYWNYELALDSPEDPEEGILLLYDSMHAFKAETSKDRKNA